MSVKGKRQVHPYLSSGAFKALRSYRGASSSGDSAIIESALLEYFADTKDMTLVMRRLDRCDRSIERMRRELALLSELSSAWIRVWYAHTPAMPVTEKKTAQRTAADRFDQLLDHVGKRFNAGKRLATEIIVEDIADQEDLAAATKSPAVNGAGDKS